MRKQKGTKQKQRKTSPKELRVKKETIKDLEPGDRKSGGIKGGLMSKWCFTVTTCDREIKQHFAEVNVHEVLTRLTGLPISMWSYQSDGPSVRHIGPMAQDMAQTFGVGEDDRHIHLADVAGIAFASIQALADQAARSREEIAGLRRELDELRKSKR